MGKEDSENSLVRQANPVNSVSGCGIGLRGRVAGAGWAPFGENRLLAGGSGVKVYPAGQVAGLVLVNRNGSPQCTSIA